MTADDYILKSAALEPIRKEMQRTCTAARRRALQHAARIIDDLPTVKRVQFVPAEPTETARHRTHAYWFPASGWLLCDNCGGRCTGGKPTPYCPWCGLPMDERMDEEIE